MLWLIHFITFELIVYGNPLRFPFFIIIPNWKVLFQNKIVFFFTMSLALMYFYFTSAELGDQNVQNIFIFLIIFYFSFFITKCCGPSLSPSAMHAILLTIFIILCLQLAGYHQIAEFYVTRNYNIERLVGFSSERSFFSYTLFWLACTVLVFKNFLKSFDFLKLLFMIVAVLILFCWPGPPATIGFIVALLFFVFTLYRLCSNPHVVCFLVIGFYLFIGVVLNLVGWSFDLMTMHVFGSWREIGFFSAIRGSNLLQVSFGDWANVLAQGYPSGHVSNASLSWISQPWSFFSVMVAELGFIPGCIISICLWRSYWQSGETKVVGAIQISLFCSYILFAPKWMLFLLVNPVKMKNIKVSK